MQMCPTRNNALCTCLTPYILYVRKHYSAGAHLWMKHLAIPAYYLVKFHVFSHPKKSLIQKGAPFQFKGFLLVGDIHSQKLTVCSLHLNIGHPKRTLVFQPSIFRCYVSFREGIRYSRFEPELTKLLEKNSQFLKAPRLVEETAEEVGCFFLRGFLCRTEGTVLEKPPLKSNGWKLKILPPLEKGETSIQTTHFLGFQPLVFRGHTSLRAHWWHGFLFLPPPKVQRPNFRDILWRMGNFCISWGRSSFPVSDFFRCKNDETQQALALFLGDPSDPFKEICHDFFSSYTWTPSVIFLWSLPDIFLFRPGIRWAVVVETQCFFFETWCGNIRGAFFLKGDGMKIINSSCTFQVVVLKMFQTWRRWCTSTSLFFQTRWFNHQLGVSVFLGPSLQTFFSGWSF